MEPLENRIARLTPEQQQEVGDFVDFLLLKNNFGQTGAPTQFTAPPACTPPVMVPDTLAHPPGIPAVALPVPQPASPSGSPDAGLSGGDASPGPIHEIIVGSDDRVTRDYMDYGAFDDTPSPATEAVKKVKQKIIARQEKDKPGHILDWVD
jgi:hypothetical protein